jgi:hypothetical protein
VEKIIEFCEEMIEKQFKLKKMWESKRDFYDHGSKYYEEYDVLVSFADNSLDCYGRCLHKAIEITKGFN